MTLANLAEWQKSLEKRLAALENKIGIRLPEQPETLELSIEFPEDDIDGLHFNRQKVNGVFDLKEDGNYHSRDILFMSARNTIDNNSRDILSAYLRSEKVKKAFLTALSHAGYVSASIRISLPDESEDAKKYNGVPCWYWLENKGDMSSAYFAFVSSNGFSYNGIGIASRSGGCAPIISVEWRNE